MAKSEFGVVGPCRLSLDAVAIVTRALLSLRVFSPSLNNIQIACYDRCCVQTVILSAYLSYIFYNCYVRPSRPIVCCNTMLKSWWIIRKIILQKGLECVPKSSFWLILRLPICQTWNDHFFGVGGVAVVIC